MTQVILQPCASKSAQLHFVSNIETPLAYQAYQELFEASDFDAIRQAHPDGTVQLWGAKPGETNQNVAPWARITPGDYVLFSAFGKVFAAGVVSHSMRNPELASSLWGEVPTKNDLSQSWELMFSVDQLQSIDLNYPTLNGLVGRKPAAVPQQFAVLDESKSQRVLDYLNLIDTPHDESSKDEYESEVLAEGFDELERMVLGVLRLEQRYLRNVLLPGPVGTCALCGRDFPSNLITAAHIKRRSVCSDSEKRRFKDVAMPACRFGCDELFGRGLVAVDAHGDVAISPLLTPGAALEYVETFLMGKSCSAWANPGSREFFQFHLATDFKTMAVLPIS